MMSLGCRYSGIHGNSKKAIKTGIFFWHVICLGMAREIVIESFILEAG
jgi:hypothetical protein